MPAPRTNAAHDQNFVPTLMGVSSSDGTTPVPVEVDPATGAMLTSATIGMFTLSYDEVDVTYPTASTEVYVTKLATVTRQTVTVTYTDATKANISSVVRS